MSPPAVGGHMRRKDCVFLGDKEQDGPGFFPDCDIFPPLGHSSCTWGERWALAACRELPSISWEGACSL